MRYHILFTVLFSLLIVNSGHSQQAQQRTLKLAVVSAMPDTVDQNLQVPIPGVQDSSETRDLFHFRMPIANPCCAEAKMKYWWPSEEYHYNMPNAYRGMVSPYRFRYRK